LDQGARTELAELSLADYRRGVLENYRAVRAETDPERAHAGWRERRDRLFRDHPQSPLGADDPLRETGLPYWPYDPALRFEIALSETPDPVTRTFSTAPGEITQMRRLGWVTLPAPVDGRLAVWWLEQYSGGIFLPFRDATAGDSSYGAGRYLLDTTKGADLGGGAGRLVLDFNFSYHPSCRYDEAWQCPLAPPENVLAAEVRAGERL
jgi:uncharacterized protein (DUF1684 family)